MEAPKRTKYAYWLILAFFSTVFAEMLSGSFPYVFTNPWGWLGVIPLYGLHALVLWYAATSKGRLRFSTLFLCGVIFGLYEAYITKVLWSPNWDAMATQFLGVYWLETTVLILWWHPFMSFIVPLFAASALMTGEWGIVGLPPRFRRWFTSGRRGVYLIIFAIWVGTFAGSMLPFPHSVFAPLASFAVLAACVTLWKRRHGREYALAELRPDASQAKWLFAGLLGVYLVFFLLFDLDEMPGLVPQAVILLIYAVVLLGLWKGLEKEPGRPVDERPWSFSMDLKRFTVLFIVFYVVTIIFSLAGIGAASLIVGWLAGSAVGLYCLVYSMADVLRH